MSGPGQCGGVGLGLENGEMVGLLVFIHCFVFSAGRLCSWTSCGWGTKGWWWPSWSLLVSYSPATERWTGGEGEGPDLGEGYRPSMEDT